MYRLKKGYDSSVWLASTPEKWEIVPYKSQQKKSRGTNRKS